jgi:hypothetical protein
MILNKYVFQSFPNIELIAMNITSEYLGIDSECQLFRVIEGSYLEDKIERSVYNRRKRLLFPYMEQLRIQLSSQSHKALDEYL